MNNDNPAYYPDLIDYLTNPEDNRTWKQFCVSISVEYDAVWRFRKSHAAQIEKDVANVGLKYIGVIRAAALKSLFNRLNKSDAAIKMALTMTGDLVEKSEHITTVRTPEEKRARIEEIMSKLSANLDKK